jgi:hypothetical protein
MGCMSAAVVLMILHFSIVCKNRVGEVKIPNVIATITGSISDTVLMHLGSFEIRKSINS